MTPHEQALSGITADEARQLSEARTAPALSPDPATPPPARPLSPDPALDMPGLSDKKWTPPELEEEAPAAQPDAQQAAPGPTPQDGQQGGVPPAALTEERNKRRQAEEQLAQTSTQQQLLSERLTMLQQAISDGQKDRLDAAQQAQVPDPNEDVVGYIKAVEKQYTERLAEQQRRLDAHDARAAEDTQVNDIRTRSSSDAQAFAQTQPDFVNAYTWLRNEQIGELTAQGIAPAVASQAIDRRELQLFAAHQQAGRNSAEAYYQAAVRRGWQQPQAPNGGGQPVQAATAVGAYDQGPAPAAQPPVQNPPGRAMLPNMQAGMLESRSVGQAASGGTAMPMDLAAYGSMTDAEFARHRDTVRSMMRNQMG